MNLHWSPDTARASLDRLYLYDSGTSVGYVILDHWKEVEFRCASGKRFFMRRVFEGRLLDQSGISCFRRPLRQAQRRVERAYAAFIEGRVRKTLEK